MNLSKILGILFIAFGLGLGYLGFNKIQENTNEVNLLGLKIEASNEAAKQKGYMYLGFGAILLIGGIYTINKSK